MRFGYSDNELVVKITTCDQGSDPWPTMATRFVWESDFSLVPVSLPCAERHTVNGQRFDLEAHLVHENATGQLAVVGVFMNMATTPTSSSTTCSNRPRGGRRGD